VAKKRPNTPSRQRLIDRLPTSWAAAFTVAAKYGIWALVGLALMYVIVIRQAAQFDRMTEDIRTLQSSITSLVGHFQDDRDQMWALIAVNQRTCLNTAKTDQDRLNCVISARGKN